MYRDARNFALPPSSALRSAASVAALEKLLPAAARAMGVKLDLKPSMRSDTSVMFVFTVPEEADAADLILLLKTAVANALVLPSEAFIAELDYATAAASKLKPGELKGKPASILAATLDSAPPRPSAPATDDDETP